MNEKQWNWTNRRCEELRKFLEKNSDLSDKVCEDTIGYINVITSLANGEKEVQSALFAVLEEFQREYERNKK